MSRIIDGQKSERADPMAPITFRNLAVQQIAAPETIEVSMSLFDELLEADEWAATVPMDLSEMKGA